MHACMYDKRILLFGFLLWFVQFIYIHCCSYSTLRTCVRVGVCVGVGVGVGVGECACVYACVCVYACACVCV